MKLLALWALLAVVGSASAQSVSTVPNWPAHAVRIIVPSAPGGTLDIVTRLLSQKMSGGLGQPVVVENRPASATTIAEEYVARSAPDGYTLLLSGTSRATNPHLHRDLTYDPVNDLASVSLVAKSGNVLVVNSSLPVKSVNELIALSRSESKPLFYGTAAFGSSGHLAAELFNRMAGTKFVHVPYKGAAPALADLSSGQIHMTFDNIPVVIAHIRSGRLRALGVTSAVRSPLLPEVPTIAEAGLPGYEMTAMFGISAPARTPEQIVSHLGAEIAATVRSPEVSERFARLGLEAVGSSPEEYQRLVASESERLGRLIREAGIRPE